MSPGILPDLDRLLASENGPSCLDFLAAHFRDRKEFTLLFEARLMKKRLELGLPLVQTGDSSTLPADTRAAYDQGIMEAAREAGTLFLAEGNIERAWPYFRAINDPDPVIAAIDRFQPDAANPDASAAIIGIAFQEGLHPARGLALILEAQGMCRAITTFGMYGVQKDRDKCIALLVRGLHVEIVNRMKSAIESQEGKTPDGDCLIDLMANRDYLFGEYDYYVDNSHLTSLLPYCVDVTCPQTLAIYHELCEYGKHLSAQFETRGHPPFENPFVDYGSYVQALRGIAVDEAVAHFEKIVAAADPEEFGPGPAQALIDLLVKLGRPKDALAVSLQYLPGDPSALQLCAISRDFDRLKDLARERQDLLSYAAAGIEGRAR